MHIYQEKQLNIKKRRHTSCIGVPLYKIWYVRIRHQKNTSTYFSYHNQIVQSQRTFHQTHYIIYSKFSVCQIIIDNFAPNFNSYIFMTYIVYYRNRFALIIATPYNRCNTVIVSGKPLVMVIIR